MQKSQIPYGGLLLVFGVLLGVLGGYYVVVGTREHPIAPAWYVAGGDRERGRAAMVRHGCIACHVIPGIRTATGRVGPQLTGLSSQVYIGGVLPNTPENLVFWIQHPQEASPRTAMPDLQVTEAEARDMAAYLYAQ